MLISQTIICRLFKYKPYDKWNPWPSIANHKNYLINFFLLQLQTYFQIIDDIEDEAIIRNGKIPWHVYRDVKMAINDNSMLRSFMQEMMRRNLDSKLYVKVYDILNEVSNEYDVCRKFIAV